ncbi:MAG: hypothetical protein LBU57_02920 [Dysgonamonadaceae bacterium]|jgi:hypothetical protein|nr:hypothetical protein [Dysgonamonadaceae bacterium]
MKYFKFLLFSILVALVATACTPQEFDDYKLGDSYTLTQDQFTFDITPGSGTWTYNFTAAFSVDAVKYPYSYEIRFGDGNVTKDLKGTHEYVVLAGTYTAQCLVYTPNGDVLVKEKTITFTEDNPLVYQDNPASPEFAFTGGKDNLQGKEWMLKAGSGLGPIDQTWGEWWDFGNNYALFNDVFIFQPNNIQKNGKYIYDNNGDTFSNESLAGLFSDGDPAGSFVTYEYIPSSDASWSIEVRNGINWLVINKGFIGYPVTPNDLNKAEYEILSFSPSEIHLKYYSSDGNAWFFFLTSEEPAEVIALTGGSDNPQGKAWKWRPADAGAGVVMTRTQTGEVWWTIDATAVGAEAAYDDILTFYPDGKVKYENHGGSFMNESTASLFGDGNADGSFITTEYTPSANATWNFTTIDGIMYLALSNVFPMYGLSPELINGGNYEVVEITGDLMHIKYVAGTGEWDVTWNFYLVPAN